MGQPKTTYEGDSLGRYNTNEAYAKSHKGLTPSQPKTLKYYVDGFSSLYGVPLMGHYRRRIHYSKRHFHSTTPQKKALKENK